MPRALSALGRLTLLLLKRAREVANPVARLQRWIDVLQEAHAAPNGIQAISLVASYIAEVGEGVSEPLKSLFRALGPTGEEAIVTIAEQWRAEGQSDLLLKQLALRFGPLQAETARRVRNATTEERELWAERILTAATLEELFR